MIVSKLLKLLQLFCCKYRELPPIQYYLTFYTGLEIYIEEDHCTIHEGQTQNPMIQLRFVRTQNPFTVTLFPVSIEEAIDPTGFNLSTLITPQTVAKATPGKSSGMSNTLILSRVYFGHNIMRYCCTLPHMYTIVLQWNIVYFPCRCRLC